MTKTPSVELVRSGGYLAEVDVELIETEGGWSPYYSLEDAKKIEAVQIALDRGDVVAAAKLGRVFKVFPVAAE